MALPPMPAALACGSLPMQPDGEGVMVINTNNHIEQPRACIARREAVA